MTQLLGAPSPIASETITSDAVGAKTVENFLRIRYDAVTEDRYFASSEIRHHAGRKRSGPLDRGFALQKPNEVQDRLNHRLGRGPDLLNHGFFCVHDGNIRDESRTGKLPGEVGIE